MNSKIIYLVLKEYILLLLLFILSTGYAQAATLTVGPGQSLKDAIGKMAGGDTLVIKGGTYKEGNLTPPSGEQGSPTRLIAEAGQQVILAPNDQSIDTIFLFENSHDIVMDGLTLEGDYKTGFPIYSGAGAARLVFQNGTIRHGRQSGGLLGGTAWVLKNNQILDNGKNCCATHSDDHGLYFQASNSLVEGNNFQGGACYNIQIYGGPDPSNVTIQGNRFTGSKCGVTLTHGKGHIFKNNISVDDGGYYGPDGVLIFSPGTTVLDNTVVRRNIVTVQNGDSASVTIKNNQLCEGKVVTTKATVSNNQVSCNNLPDLTKPPMATGPQPPPVVVEPPPVIEPLPPVAQGPVLLGPPRNVKVKLLP